MSERDFIISAISGVAIGLAILLGGLVIFVRLFQ